MVVRGKMDTAASAESNYALGHSARELAGRLSGTDILEAVAWANARAGSGQIRNVELVNGDPTDMEFNRPIDAIIGRFAHMDYADPVDAVRKLAGPAG